jgi:hypothetical protein
LENHKHPIKITDRSQCRSFRGVGTLSLQLLQLGLELLDLILVATFLSLLELFGNLINYWKEIRKILLFFQNTKHTT